MTDDNDLSAAVLDVRESPVKESAAASLMSKYAPQQPAQDGVPHGSTYQTLPDGGMRVEIAHEEPKVSDQIKDVAKDVGRGILETPRATVGGVRDAAQAAILDPINELAGWLEEKMPLGSIKVGADGISHEKGAQGFELPDVPKPDSVTGGLVRGVAQWLTGFLGPGAMATKSMQAAGTAARAGKAALQGAVADFTAFDGQEKRLSDLIQEYPALQNPVNEYLASNEDDSFIEGRFKNAVEGLGLGVVTDGMLMGLKAVRAARIAKRAEGGAVTPVNLRPEVQPDAFKVLGDETAPLLAPRTPLPGPKSGDLDLAEQTARGIAKPTPGETYINFARIDTPEDVQNVMQQMADGFKGDVDAARRGEHMPFSQMKLNAEQEDAFKVLAERRQGQPLNAEQSLAARQLWAASAEKLTEVAKLAAENPSEANLFAFRKMLATHYAIQNEVIAARTETARALASWRIPAGSGMERFAQIEDALRSTGDPALSREMADRIAKLGSANMPRELDAVVRGSLWARGRDAFLEAWVNGLLSGPKTHLVNMMSNTGVIFQQMYERATAAQIARALGSDGSVQAGEATAQLFGMVSGFKDALRYSAKTLRTNEAGFGMGKIDLPRARAISSEAWGMAKDSPLGRSVDVLGATVSVPGRLLAAEDEFFKTLGYRMELNALALRRATQEVNAGTIKPDQLKARIADILADPPVDIKLDAIDQATYQTFTSAPGNLTKAVTKLANAAPFPGRLILPFIRTPGNILKYTFERTPLAPLMSHVRADIAAGGARRDIALARIATGSMMMAASADLAFSGQITGKGPADRRERQALERTGWQPYSLKVGDRYYAYNRADPIGTTLGLAADMVEILSNMDDEEALSDSEIESTQAAIAMALANNAMNKSYMTGMADLFTAMSDPDRYGKSYFQRLAGSAVPTGVAEVARAMDPYALEADTMMERIRSRVPGLTKNLPARRDLWGEAISYRSGLGAIYDTVSPIYSSQAKESPIDKEMIRLDAFTSMPARKTGFEGVRVNLDNYHGAYSRFVQLAGNEAKDPAWDLGAKDFLNQVVTGKHPMSQVYERFSDGPEGGKADFIRTTINRYREIAKKQLLEEFPALRADVEAKKRQQLQDTIDAAIGVN